MLLRSAARRAAAAGEPSPTICLLHNQSPVSLVPMTVSDQDAPPGVPVQAHAVGQAAQNLNQDCAAAYATTAYAEALSRGGVEALAQVNLAVGDLLLDLARGQPSPAALQMLKSAAD